MKSNKTVKIIIFTALLLSAVILISVMTGAVKETTADTDSVKLARNNVSLTFKG